MYSYKDRTRAVQLYIKLGKRGITQYRRARDQAPNDHKEE
ncbi:hypothetical protein P3T31_004273 [Rhizobium sp. AN70]|nr:hypothetical protein [Rhizobium sp. AN70]